jgi:hypothetical protein
MSTGGSPKCPGCPYVKVRSKFASADLLRRWADRQGKQWAYGRDGCPWWHYCQKCRLTEWPYDLRTWTVHGQTLLDAAVEELCKASTRCSERRGQARKGMPRQGLYRKICLKPRIDLKVLPLAGGSTQDNHKTITRQSQDNPQDNHFLLTGVCIRENRKFLIF